MSKSKGLIVTWGSVVRVVIGHIRVVHVATGVVVDVWVVPVATGVVGHVWRVPVKTVTMGRLSQESLLVSVTTMLNVSLNVANVRDWGSL